MKRFGFFLMAGVVAASVALTGVAEAKRLGGGGSMGTQRSMSPPASSAPSGAASQPVMPATPGATLPAKPAAAATPAPAPAKSFIQRWAAPLAGLAAGLGLAALLSHFGLPEGIGGLLLVAAFFIAMAFLLRMLLARRAAPTPAMQYAGRAEPQTAPDAFQPTPTPAWGGAPKPAPVATPAPEPANARALPPGFDAAGFTEQAKNQFRRLQAAFDAADRATLADVMTPQMYDEVARQLDTRFGHHPTEIESLSADVLEVATEGSAYWASVRYTGRVREDGETTAKSIDEVWNLTKPVDGSSGWLLAGIQQTA